ncbi:MAG: peptidase M28, partial [Saprospiraceae bacterium]|nr:peptidase M28 [Saprospiraceae bacterium]
LSVIQHWDCNQTYLNLSPMGEPQLGKRGLYQAIGGQSDSHEQQMAMLWILNQSDGKHTLLDVARKSGIPLFTLHKVAGILQEKKLLQRIH